MSYPTYSDHTHDLARALGAEIVRLPGRFYWPIGSGRPWGHALAFVTDGEQYGVLYAQGYIDWLSKSADVAFGMGAQSSLTLLTDQGIPDVEPH